MAKTLKVTIFLLDLFLEHRIAKTRAGKSKGKPASAFVCPVQMQPEQCFIVKRYSEGTGK